MHRLSNPLDLEKHLIAMCEVPRGEPNALLAELIEALHQPNHRDALQLIATIRNGIFLPYPRTVARAKAVRSESFSIARVFVHHDRVDLLRSLVLAGAPPAAQANPQLFPTLAGDTDAPIGTEWWLCLLCSINRKGYLRTANPFWDALEYIGPGSRDLLALGDEVCPNHRAKSNVLPVHCTVPGTLHFSLLSWVLAGHNANIREVVTLASTTANYRTNYSVPDDHDADKQGWMRKALDYMLAERYPMVSTGDSERPLDGAPFCFTFNPHLSDADHKQVLVAYRDAGLVDLDAPVSDHWGLGHGMTPIEIAVSRGSPQGAKSLLELGCRIDESAPMFAMHGSSIVAAAEASDAYEDNATMAATVKEALMRRQIDAASSNPEGPVHQGAAAPRRRASF